MNKRAKILFPHNNLNKETDIEAAWAIKEGEYYKLDNILFYAKKYSLGDIVNVEKGNGEHYVAGLIEESGHSTVRIFFGKTDDIQNTRDQLRKIGCTSEISNIPSLISVDIPSDVSYVVIKKFLDEGEEKGKWEYEEACISNVHNEQLLNIRRLY